tara:strand:- start:100 stop:738 length:639 start_codon:yes stop_codon:yes gene_type:complete
MSTNKDRAKTSQRLQSSLDKKNKTLAKLKEKLEQRLAERESMSKRYELLIKQAQKISDKRAITKDDATKKINRDYQYLTNRINSLKAEILSLEGGVITKEVLPWILGEQPKRGGFGRNFGLKSSYESNGKTYQYKEGDLYFHDKIGANELQIINRMQDDTPKGDKYNLGDTTEGGEISQEMEDRALSANFYQKLQIKNNESKLNKTYTNGTF